MLLLPPSIRIPSADELPHREDAVELLAARKHANITQGFITHLNKTLQLAYNFSAEININNDKLWQLFTALASLMPAEVCCNYGSYEDEAITSGYFDKVDVLNTLTKFKDELAMDCSLEFGLLSQTKEQLNEIFVTESKYIKFWGSDKAGFLQIMKEFKLTEIKDLAFVDEYPKVVAPLRNFMPKATRPGEVVRALNKAFGVNG